MYYQCNSRWKFFILFLLLFSSGHVSSTFPEVQLRLRKGSNGTPQSQTAHWTHQQGGPRNTRQTRTETLRAWCCTREKSMFDILQYILTSLYVLSLLVDTTSASSERARGWWADHHRFRRWVWAGPLWCHTRGDHRFGRLELQFYFIGADYVIVIFRMWGQMNYHLVNTLLFRLAQWAVKIFTFYYWNKKHLFVQINVFCSHFGLPFNDESGSVPRLSAQQGPTSRSWLGWYYQSFEAQNIPNWPTKRHRCRWHNQKSQRRRS